MILQEKIFKLVYTTDSVVFVIHTETNPHTRIIFQYM